VTSTNKKDVKNDVKNGYEAPWNAKIIKMRTNASFIYYSGAWKGLSEIVVVNLSQQKRLSSFFFLFYFHIPQLFSLRLLNPAVVQELLQRAGAPALI
jgi:hypothetical protein